MEKDLTPNVAEAVDRYCAHAREILNVLSEYRAHPSRLKIADSGPRVRGGNSTVVIGTIIPPERVPTWIPEQLLGDLLNSSYAIKKLNWDREDVEESVKTFKLFVNELKIMSELDHDNIVKLIGFVEDMQTGDAWIVVPWEANGNVREFLQSGEWYIPERISLIKDVVKGVEYLHTRQPPVCHGDLKSLNILVNSSYHAVITDFGSARNKPNGHAQEHNASEAHCGPANDGDAKGSKSPHIKWNSTTLELTLTGPGFSLRWTAPEVLDDGVQDLPSDMWAVGWICWEIVTGKIPFEELDRDGPIVANVVLGKLPKIRENTQLSQVLVLCGLMSDCWVSDPKRRIRASDMEPRLSLMPSIAPSVSSAGEEKMRSAELLMQLGEMHRRQGDTARAEPYFKSALGVAARTKDHRTRANAFLCLGAIYYSHSKHREAEGALREAHEVHSRMGNHRDTAYALAGLAKIYSAQSRFKEAEEALWKAHEICSRIGKDIGIADMLLGLGSIYYAQSRHREAEEVLSKAHQIHCRIGNELGIANALHGLGKIYPGQSRDREVEEMLWKAHEIHSRIGNQTGTADVLHSLGEIYDAQAKNKEAEQAFGEAHEIYSRIGNDMGTANALRSLGESYYAQSRYAEAEEALKKAHEIHSHIGNDVGTADALHSLGNIYRIRFENREGEEAFRKAHETYSRIGNQRGTGNALEGLGWIYYTQSRHWEAEEAFQEAHQLHSRIGYEMGFANALQGLGTIYRVQSRDREAEEFLWKAHEIHSRIGHDLGTANALDGLGHLYGAQKRYKDAEKALGEAREIHSRIGNDQGAANALNGLGQIYLAQSRYKEAEEALWKAHQIHSRIGHDLGAANALLSLGDIYRAESRSLEAEKLLREAHRICSLLNHAMGTGNSSRRLGTLFSKRGQFEEAQSLFCQALSEYKRAGSCFSRAEVLLDIAGVYCIRGNYLQEEESLTEALTIGVRLKDDSLQDAPLELLAQIFRFKSKYSVTLAAPLQTGATCQQMSVDIRRGVALHNLGREFIVEGKFKQAENSYSLARALFSRAREARGEACAIRSLGTLFTLHSRLETASQCFAQARTISVAISDSDGEIMALGCLMGACLLQGNLARLRSYCVEALKIYDRTSGIQVKSLPLPREHLQDS